MNMMAIAIGKPVDNLSELQVFSSLCACHLIKEDQSLSTLIIIMLTIGFGIGIEYTTRRRKEEGNIAAVQNFAVPKTKKDLRAFLGLIGIFRETTIHYSLAQINRFKEK